jgi:hypothetical protein
VTAALLLLAFVLLVIGAAAGTALQRPEGRLDAAASAGVIATTWSSVRSC